MAAAADLQGLDELCPWDDADFRADLELLAGGAAAAASAYAADLRTVARLAARVPRCPFDERGATPWTSFRREVAVARKVSDRAAAALIRCALRLTSVLPRAMGLLESGVLTVPRAVALVTELEPVADDVAGQVDAELAQVLPLLPVWRIEQEVRRAVLRLDPEAAAARTAVKNADRGVTLTPDVDDQAVVSLTGPAVPLTRWYATVDARARALKAAGDPRPLDALRFDVATADHPCADHAPADATGEPAEVPTAAGTRPGHVEPAPVDCRRSRPVQATVVVPVETALGLSNEPGWLDGYGWLSAPTCRLLLVDAELRQACVRSGTGELVDLPAGVRRPAPTPAALRESLLDMVLSDVELSDVGWRSEPEHDPSDRLRDFVALRDRSCDGPTGARVPAARAELDHDRPWPYGPTAAWNLTARGARTHRLKHAGWTPLRTPSSTLWFSPAGQLLEVPRHRDRPPGVDRDADRPAVLPDADDLACLDRLQLTAPVDDRPVLPVAADDRTAWTWLDADEPAPF